MKILQEEKNLKLAMKNNVRSIKQANLAKRLISVIIDGALFAFLFVFFLTLVFSKIADKAFDYSQKGAQGLTHEINSHLYVTAERDEDGKLVKKEISDLTSDQFEVVTLEELGEEDCSVYHEAVKYYYLNYKTGNVDVSTLPEGADKADYVLPGYEKLPENQYTEAWFNEKIASFPTDKTELENYRNLALEAGQDLAQTEFFKDLKKDLNKIQIFIMVLSLTCSYSIIFFMFPLIFKNGQTIGKKMFGICFVTKDGYDIKRRQIVFRQLIIFVSVLLGAFCIGIELITSAVTLCAGVAIYFVAVAISKTNKSYADYLAYTYLIEAKTSVWFHDAEEEERIESEYSEKVEKINKNREKNENVIQIGSEIVDENIKKEVELSKKSSRKK